MLLHIILWGALIVAAIVIEISTIALTSIWFAVGGLVALILAIFEVNIGWQILAFILVSGISLLATRPIAKKLNTKAVIYTNADKIISMVGVVTKQIDVGEIGEVRVNSEFWRAVSMETTNIEVGEKVIINSLSGNKVLVSRINNENDDMKTI